MNEKIKCTCECGKEEWYPTPEGLLMGYRCEQCAKDKRLIKLHNKTKSLHTGIYYTRNDLMEYLCDKDLGYILTESSSMAVECKCPLCGMKKNKKVKIRDLSKQGFRCDYCYDGISMPEKIMRSILFQIGYDFKPEYSPKWVGGKRYDFYVPSKNLIIEMDGNLGHGNSTHPKSKITADESLIIDKIKDGLAKLNGVDVVRIDCTVSELQYIKENILKSSIPLFFDLSNIDWMRVKREMLSSFMIEVINMYKNGMDINSISTEKKISKVTVRKYLKLIDELKSGGINE